MTADLATLTAARDQALEIATGSPTGKNRKALRDAQKAIEEYHRAQAEPAGTEILSGIGAVIEYLDGEGWKISRSTAYDHWKKEGKLRARSDGRFDLAAVLAYARDHLQRKDGSPASANLAEDKQRAEIARIQADAATRELKYRQLTGELMPRSQVEIELSERASSLRGYLDAVARSASGRVIKLVGGDPQKSAELIAWWLAMNRKAMDNYARPIKGLEEEED